MATNVTAAGGHMMTADALDHDPWPKRAIYLLLLGAVLGLVFDGLIGDPQQAWTTDVFRLSGAFFVLVSGIVFALTLERLRWLWSVAFAAAAGLVVASVYYWNGSPDGWRAGQEWQLIAALLAIFIAAPLFQSSRDAGRWNPDYPAVYGYAWGNIVLWGAAWAFVLITWLLSQLMAELFNLIGIDALREALRESWFTFMLLGAALGAAFGMLRDRDKIVGLLQRVGMTILAVLAPILALGLALFVLALPFTGLEPLWEQTTATTPVLLSCVIGALILANAVIGQGPEEEARQPLLRYSAMALGAVILPLAIVAAISTWLRIDQYGFTPERLWGLVFVGVCVAVALAYFAALVIGRARWAERVRGANIGLAIGICALALLLATPLLDFGSISARDQLARLQQGEVSPEEFDWAAMRFDFGPAGERALAQLRNSGSPAIRALAAKALQSRERWVLAEDATANRRARALRQSIRVMPQHVPVPDGLRQALARGSICAVGDCALFWKPGDTEAVAVGFGCPDCLASTTNFRIGPKGEWQPVPTGAHPTPRDTADDHRKIAESQRQAVAAGRVEVREVVSRQVYIDGRPVAAPF